MVGAEALALEFARRVGIVTTHSIVTTSLGREVLVIERYDRSHGGRRRIVVSGLTMLGLDEMKGSYATYPDLLDMLRRKGSDQGIGRRLFQRIAFNVAVGNDDDHARNHAASWDGHPGADASLRPVSANQVRETSLQALAFDREGTRDSSFAACVAAAPVYGLTAAEARDVIDEQIAVIERDWDEVADLARLTTAQRNVLWHRQIFNPFAIYGY